MMPSVALRSALAKPELHVQYNRVVAKIRIRSQKSEDVQNAQSQAKVGSPSQDYV